MQKPNPFSPPASDVDATGISNKHSRLFRAFAVVVLLNAAIWACYIGMYYELVRTGAMSILHFLGLFGSFAFAVMGSLRILFRAPPPVLLFTLATVFGLVALQRPMLVFELIRLALAFVGGVASLALRNIEKAKGFRAEV